MSGAIVEIVPVQSSTSWFKVLTNWDGAFELVEPPGKYVIYAHASGYADFTTTFTKTASVDEPLKIQLVRSPSMSQSPVQPSFSCAKATTRVELLICSNAHLADLDRQMDSTYHRVLDSLPPHLQSPFRQAQREWFRRYSSTCNRIDNDRDRADCIATYLSGRTTELRNR
jgi:uncharacterized protein YecT (DUF1311 family)